MAQRPDWIPSVELDSIYTQHLLARRLCSVQSSFSKHFLDEMGRVRAPCCDMRGLKRGTWSEAEDRLLVAHILKYGHENWRALPKLAGLSRCGKSCRLRWLNYLNPHLKRGNFSPEEEETVIRMHKDLGNKWSKIASQLPGRTDNEIKNVWHSYLKRRLEPQDSSGSDNEARKPSGSSSSPSSSSGNSCISWSRTDAAQEETKEEASNEDQDMDPSEMQENISGSDAALETNQHCNPVLEEVEEEWAADLENELVLQDENYGRQELATPPPEADDDPADMYLHMWSSPPKLYN